MKWQLLCGILLSALRISIGETEAEKIANFLRQVTYPELGIPRSISTSSNVGYTINSKPYTTYYGTHRDEFRIPQNTCGYITDEIITDFRLRIYKFLTYIYNKTNALAEGHFVFSPYTIWLTLAALAEGSEGKTRQELFGLLSLPEDACIRRMFYHLATTRENPSNDVIIARNRLFIADSNINVNKYWENIARTQTNLETVSIPFKTNPYVEQLKRIFNAELPNINLSGNSILLESLDYRGLWTSAFSDAIIETGPFYNALGEAIGTMEYMKTTKRIKFYYAASTNFWLIELPIGRDSRYRMFFGLIEGSDQGRFLTDLKETLIFETLFNLKQSSTPIEIVVPRLTMTSEIDVRHILENIGVTSLWNDPSATRNISYPSALPSSFIQRSTVTIDNSGVRPSVQEYSNFVPPYPADDGQSLKRFVANKPFIFGLFDSELYINLFAATFSKPYP